MPVSAGSCAGGRGRGWCPTGAGRLRLLPGRWGGEQPADERVGWLTAQDRGLGRLQGGAGLDALLLGQHPPPVAVHGKRVGAAAGLVEGEHEPPPQPFVQRCLADQAGQLRDRGRVPAEHELGVQAPLQQREPHLLQSC